MDGVEFVAVGEDVFDCVGLVEGLGPRGSLRVLRSPYGHDAFLKETDRIDAILATAFRTSGESA